MDVRVDLAVLVVVDGVGDLLAGAGQCLSDLARAGGDGRRPDSSAGLEDLRRDRPGAGRGVCRVEVALPLLPVLQSGVAAGGQRLADAGRSPAQADVAVLPDGVGELGEAAVLAGDQERRRDRGLGWRVAGELAEPSGEEAPAVVRSCRAGCARRSGQSVA